VQPLWGELPRTGAALSPSKPHPRIGILFYRAQQTAGNTDYVHALADAVDAAGGVSRPIFAASLRDAPAELLAHLATFDALITTVLAAGGTRPANVSAGGDDEAWDVRALAALDVPILQGLCLTRDRASWAESDEGMTPLDVATQVAVTEFDGRIITVPFSFKETDADGLPHYVPDPERCRRVAEIAVAHASLRYLHPSERKIAIVLSAYPTKHSRIGNAVGLDTPRSLISLLRAMREAGYDLGPEGAIPGTGPQPIVDGEHPDTTAGNALIHALIAAGGQDPEWLTQEQLSGQPVRIEADQYRGWLSELPPDLVERVRRTWGEAPGDLFVDRSRDPSGEIVAATLQAGNVVILVQPPRGFGENPIAIYHDPDLAPSHHYLAVYRWLEREFGAHAMIHLGKHGNLEWLPGKNVGMSASCGTDAAIGSMPLVYPFLVNDPGEGAQAKRRAHATIIDHLIPPMARAESYGDIARLEQLLDEYAQVIAMDPAKAPALRGEIWTLIQSAKLDHDLGLTDRPDDGVFDEFILHVDGWLCEIKDAQIRDGLHILGEAPERDGLINLVLAILRSNQVFGGQVNSVPGLRVALGLTENSSGSLPHPLLASAPDIAGADVRQGCERLSGEVDAVEEQARALVTALAAAGWDVDRVADVCRTVLGAVTPGVVASLRFACEEVVPRLAATTNEITATLHALDGGYVAAGPSGSPLRGLVNVLPTGRNFYSVDPKAIPSRLAWETGQAMAESLLARYRTDTGDWPRSVGLSAWGTSAMRTAGDDVAEILALLGVRPVWDEASRRVSGLELISLAELDRPRIDVTVRISGFFRDAFPHVVAMLDDAVQLVAQQDEPHDQNFIRAHAQADLAAHGDQRRATLRV
ncbi:MAG: cobaltochelatase subunit CobN, partial [Propionibacteriaceae bacterium]|nr:cobaltochelatase subunit CobN [Propionibacteriaceae bacterium]